MAVNTCMFCFLFVIKTALEIPVRFHISIFEGYLYPFDSECTVIFGLEPDAVVSLFENFVG